MPTASIVTNLSIALAALGVTVATLAAVYARRQSSHSRTQADAAREQAAIAMEQLALMRRPIIIPVTTGKWWNEGGGEKRTAIWVRNGGNGPALNVRATLAQPSDLTTNAQALGPGDTATLAFDGDQRSAITTWDGVRGVISYETLEGDRWETRFAFTHQPGQRAWAAIETVQPV